jgi:hypothetical protein
VNSQNTRLWSKENPNQPTKLPFTLSRLECDLQYLAAGLVGPFSSKTSLSRSVALTWSMNSSDTLPERKLSARQAQYDKEYGRLYARYPRCSVIESFRKHYSPHARRILFYGVILKTAYDGKPNYLDELTTNISNITVITANNSPHGFAGSVYGYASSCLVMYATCWCTSCKHLAWNKVLV